MRFLIVALLCALSYAQTGGTRDKRRWLRSGRRGGSRSSGSRSGSRSSTTTSSSSAGSSWASTTTAGSTFTRYTHTGRVTGSTYFGGATIEVVAPGADGCNDERAISDSDGWWNCNHASTYTCAGGEYCCCYRGFTPDSEGDCQQCPGTCMDEEPIPYSDSWMYCSWPNMYTCGTHCCCNSGYTPDADGYCSVDCPVNCVMSLWEDYGGCSTNCGGGTITRTRRIATSASAGGEECPSDTEMTESCNTQSCNTPTGDGDGGSAGGSSTSRFFSMTGYGCVAQGDCVSSANYPNDYEVEQQCTITMLQDATVTPGATFEVETCCDNLLIRGVDVESSGAVPGTLSRDDEIRWNSDWSRNYAGWQLCFASSTSTCADNDASAVAYARGTHGLTIRGCSVVRTRSTDYCNHPLYGDKARELCPATCGLCN